MQSGAGIPQTETLAAGLFGMTGRRSVVKNVKVEGEISVEASTGGNVIVGGIAGLNYGTIQNCASTVNIKASAGNGEGFCIAGGVVGVNNFNLLHVYGAGDVEAGGGKTGFAGGVVGINDFDAGVIRFCYAAGRISANDRAGGITGL